MEENNRIIIYQSENGETRIGVKLSGQTVWLTQQQMADLYQTSRSNVVQHIRNIYADGEPDEASTCKKFLQVRQEGTRRVSREIPFYNLDMIISLGYRIRSVIATHFRRWRKRKRNIASSRFGTLRPWNKPTLKPLRLSTPRRRTTGTG